ncbi:hypothetical protein BD626DRAFT_584684 [Schizophyllum amplum]|uniref:F-box domain-containing protein n=1 Tax=Schizophyllum amplum TaxID=97359 RepID=A0A550C967_9AGAR|nr:hypothetical protein BD626DRAFT_584684 [Auriculariopsis ampla]
MSESHEEDGDGSPATIGAHTLVALEGDHCINQLPNELLVEIFSFVCAAYREAVEKKYRSSEESWPYNADASVSPISTELPPPPWLLRDVCCLWRYAIDRAATLWTDPTLVIAKTRLDPVSVEMELARFRLWMNQSPQGGAAITATVDIAQLPPSFDDDVHCDVAASLTRRLASIRVLNIVVEAEQVWPLFAALSEGASASALETLNIYVSDLENLEFAVCPPNKLSAFANAVALREVSLVTPWLDLHCAWVQRLHRSPA